MARIQIANNFRTTLAADLALDGTELVLTDVTGKPELDTVGDYCIMTLVDFQGNREFVKVTEWNTAQNKAIIERGQEGTTAKVFKAGSVASNRFTAGTHRTYLESWHVREKSPATRVNDTTFTLGRDATDEYQVDRSIRFIGDSVLDGYIVSRTYTSPTMTVVVSGAIPTNLKAVELGPNVNWMPRNANAATASNATNADNADNLGNQPPSYYGVKADVDLKAPIATPEFTTSIAIDDTIIDSTDPNLLSVSSKTAPNKGFVVPLAECADNKGSKLALLDSTGMPSNFHVTELPVGSSMYFEGDAAPAGWLHRNGGIFDRTAFPDLWQHAQDKGMVKTEVEWQAEATKNGGSCSFYSSGDDSTTFRIPRNQDPIAPFIDGVVGSKGGFGTAGLPDLEGSVGWAETYGLIDATAPVSGVFSVGESKSSRLGSPFPASTNDINFKASSSNPIYGASTTVDIKRSFMLFCVKAYDFVIAASTTDMASMTASIQSNQSDILALQNANKDKVGYADFSNITILPKTTNLVQQAPKNGFLHLTVTSGSYAHIAITDSSGTVILPEAFTVQSTAGVTNATMFPVKEGTYFKATLLAGGVTLRFIQET